MLMPSFTRCYFGDEATANAADPVLALVPADRRVTLIAVLEAPEAVPPRYRFDIRFGGDAETVFFDF
jgi:protocatechuate 3,4-dioxygenase alpha subunit